MSRSSATPAGRRRWARRWRGCASAARGVEVADAARVRRSRAATTRCWSTRRAAASGTLQSRPDLRWRTSPERIAALSVLQARILRAGADATAPGGALVYSVCTISRAEGVGVVESLVRERTDFEVEDLSPMLPAAALGRFLQTLPSRDGTDGFFIARLRRTFADDRAR